LPDVDLKPSAYPRDSKFREGGVWLGFLSRKREKGKENRCEILSGNLGKGKVDNNTGGEPKRSSTKSDARKG